MRKIIVSLIVCIITVVLSGCSHRAGPKETMLKIDNLEKPSASEPMSVQKYRIMPGDQIQMVYVIHPEETEAYLIKPGDELEMKFPDRPNLDSVQLVRPDGMISLVFSGDIRVSGLTTQQASEQMRQRLGKVIRDPDVYLGVKRFGTMNEELRRVLSQGAGDEALVVKVREDGGVTLPLIGEQTLAGRTLAEANQDVGDAYRKYNPSINVNLLLIESMVDKAVHVIGEVIKPGTYEVGVGRHVSSAQALAMAGGPTPDAVLSDAVTIRQVGNRALARRVDLLKALEVDPKGNLYDMKPGDVLYVPRTQISDMANFMKHFSQVVMFRGWGFNFGAAAFDFTD